MYAVIATGGKQYKVSQGNVLDIERLTSTDGDTIVFKDVLLVVDGDSISIGRPMVDGATVSAKVVANIKGDKIRVSKFKAKAKYRRTTGHRQFLTKIQIEGINVGGTLRQAQGKKSEEKSAKKSAPVRKSREKKA